jgi:hypothetical protein
MKKKASKASSSARDKKPNAIKDLPPKNDRASSIKGGMAGRGPVGSIPTHANAIIKSGSGGY